MALKKDDYIIIATTKDGLKVAQKVTFAKKKDNYCINAVTNDGERVAILCQSMKNKDDVGIKAVTNDGEQIAIRFAQSYGYLMTFTDESSGQSYTYNPSTEAGGVAKGIQNYNEDLALWNAAIDKYGPAEGMGLFTPFPSTTSPIGGGPAAVYPAGFYPPGLAGEDVQQICGRADDGGIPLTLVNFKTMLNRVILGDPDAVLDDPDNWVPSPLPEKILICVDVSGSMTRSSLMPGIQDFELWCVDNDIVFSERNLSDERWLKWQTQWYVEMREENLAPPSP